MVPGVLFTVTKASPSKGQVAEQRGRMRVSGRIFQAVAGAVAAAWFANACSTGGFPPSGGALNEGTWGGENAGVIVTDSVTHVHIGCTFGDIPGRVAVDATGRFSADGSYILKAFPVISGPRLPAQFSGRVVGRSLTLAVAVNDTTTGKVVALGPVTVVYGRDPALGACPICRVPRMPASAARGTARTK